MKRITVLIVLSMMLAGAVSAESVSVSFSGGMTAPNESTEIIAGSKEDFPLSIYTHAGVDGRISTAYNFNEAVGLGASIGLTWNPMTDGVPYDSLSTIQFLTDLSIVPSAGDYAVVTLPVIISLGGYIQALDWSGWNIGPMAALTVGPRIKMTETCYLDLRLGAEVLMQFGQDINDMTAQVNFRSIMLGITLDFPVNSFRGFE